MATTTVERPRPAGPEEGLGGNWLVIVLNDDHNTFDHVAHTLSSVIPGVTLHGGYRFAVISRADDARASIRSEVSDAARHYRDAFERSQDPLVSIVRDVSGGVGAMFDWVTGRFTRHDDD